MSFSFGTPSSAPATTGLAGGFNFGANKPATPGFGLTATSQPSTGLFGGTTATTAPAFGTPAFGAATPAFGATSSAPAFGATTTPAFGAAAPAFGASSAAPTFGTTTPAFGATVAPTFGSTTTPAFGASSAPTFGATTAPAFGTAGLGTGGLNFGAGTNTTGTGLNFGTPAATTVTTGLGGLGGFGFGTSTAATQSTGFGAFGATTSTTNSLFGAKLGTTSVTGTLPSISATPSFGLGGVSTATGIGSTTSNATDSKSEPPKQAKLPNEISTTVDSLTEFMKKQKAMSSEVMRVSIKPLQTVSREAEARLREVSSLSSGVARARGQARRLRGAGAAALAAAEGARRELAHPGCELEGSAPPQYVKELILELEQQLATFRRQMDVADKQMQAEPKLLSEQELTLGIRRMHESLVALAGRLQAVHSEVEAQKDQYLNLRKYILKDPPDVFHTAGPNSSLDQIFRDADGSKKKIKLSSLTDLPSSAVLSDPKVALGNVQQLAGPSPFSHSLLSPFPTYETSGPSWQPQAQPSMTTLSTPFKPVSLNSSVDSNPGFQLQKPPGKRGKQ